MAAVAVAAALTLPSSGEDGAGRSAGGTSTPSATPSPSTSPSPRSPGQDASPSGTAPAGRPGASSSAPAASASTAPTRAASPPPAGPAGGGRWIAQLHSEPVSAGTAARDRRLARVRATVPEARVLRSDDYASLRPGYWVVYAPGPFTDGRAALDYCARHGRTTANTCVGRYLSREASDATLLCRPPAANPTGRCTRGG